MCSKSMSVKGTCTYDPNPLVRESCERYLFLLEFYISQIESPRLSKLNEMFCLPTTVDFRFLDFKKDEKLQLTPVDALFEPQSGLGNGIEAFNSGKSVLFALDQNTLTEIYRDFKIKASVSKRMPREMKPDVIVGKAEIDMSMHFAALRKEIVDNLRYVESAVPYPSKFFDGEVPLIFEESVIGNMRVFARISGYGQTIVTAFEAPRPEESAKSFLFKSDNQTGEDKILQYKCRVLNPTSCNASDILSESESRSKNECLVCKALKLPCSPCGVASGARISKDRNGDRRREEAKDIAHPSYLPEACGPIQTSRGRREPCGKAVVLKVSGLLDVCGDDGDKEARVTVVPESEAADAKDLNDPDHDIFILRIGKKGLVGADEKSDIQLEMRTPKGPERRPPVRLETREMQTEEDAPGKKPAKARKK